MSISTVTGGIQAAVETTEHTLTTVTAGGVYQYVVSARNMQTTVSGDPDVLALKVYGHAQASSTDELIYQAQFVGAQSETLKISLPIVSPHYFRPTLTLLSTAATGRAFEWCIYSLGT